MSEYLGLHDPGFTLRTYAHLMPESEDRARSAIDAALGAPADSLRNANRTWSRLPWSERYIRPYPPM